MTDIKFGVTYSERADFTDLPAYAQKVEELGLDSLWVTENIGSGRQRWSASQRCHSWRPIRAS